MLGILSIFAIFISLVPREAEAYNGRFADRDWSITQGTAAASTAVRISPQKVGQFHIQINGGVAWVKKNATANVESGIEIADGFLLDLERASINYDDYFTVISESAITYNYWVLD